MKFITDGMLGKLTRWLRMLGQDVEYVDDLEDKALMRIAKTEKRVLLTRDVELCRWATDQRVEAFLVEGERGVERLAAISAQFNLELTFDPEHSRCPKCNGELGSVDKAEIAHKIPPRTAMFYDEFWECSECGKIYWQGSHWERIVGMLKEADSLLEK